MQIHEITKTQLQEGILGNIASATGTALGFDAFKSPEKIAAQAAEKLQAQGYGQPRELPSLQDTLAAVKKNPAQQQYIKGLVAQWQQHIASTAPRVPAQSTTPVAPTTTATKPAPGVSVKTPSGNVVKGSDGKWKSADGVITNPADIQELERRAKQQATLAAQNKQMSPASGIREAVAATTSPGGIAIPAGAKTDVKPSSNPAYQKAFLTWAAEKLRTVDPTTRQTITLSQIEQTDIKDELDRALAQVVATAGDPAKNTVAVNNYLTIAVAGVARASQKLRQDRVYGATDKPNTPSSSAQFGQAGQAIVTQQEIRNKLAQEVGLSKTQIDALNKLGQDPAARAALLKSFGVQA
jgi:hypothetical protein